MLGSWESHSELELHSIQERWTSKDGVLFSSYWGSSGGEDPALNTGGGWGGVRIRKAQRAAKQSKCLERWDKHWTMGSVRDDLISCSGAQSGVWRQPLQKLLQDEWRVARWGWGLAGAKLRSEENSRKLVRATQPSVNVIQKERSIIVWCCCHYWRSLNLVPTRTFLLRTSERVDTFGQEDYHLLMGVLVCWAEEHLLLNLIYFRELHGRFLMWKWHGRSAVSEEKKHMVCTEIRVFVSLLILCPLALKRAYNQAARPLLILSESLLPASLASQWVLSHSVSLPQPLGAAFQSGFSFLLRRSEQLWPSLAGVSQRWGAPSLPLCSRFFSLCFSPVLWMQKVKDDRINLTSATIATFTCFAAHFWSVILLWKVILHIIARLIQRLGAFFKLLLTAIMKGWSPASMPGWRIHSPQWCTPNVAPSPFFLPVLKKQKNTIRMVNLWLRYIGRFELSFTNDSGLNT